MHITILYKNIYGKKSVSLKMKVCAVEVYLQVALYNKDTYIQYNTKKK